LHRRYWLILSILVPVLIVAGVVGVAVSQQTTREPASALTAQEARILRLKHSVADNPSDFDSRLRLGWTYQQAKRYSEALEQYDIILKRRPRSMSTLYFRALIYRDMGADIQSRDTLLRVLEIRKDHVLAAIALGQYYLARGEYANLRKVVGPAVKLHPEAGELQYLMGRGLEGKNDFEGARARYRKALKYAPDLASARTRLRRLDQRSEATGSHTDTSTAPQAR
jgi:tetratricopeptide (TPR) repeat protein